MYIFTSTPSYKPPVLPEKKGRSHTYPAFAPPRLETEQHDSCGPGPKPHWKYHLAIEKGPFIVAIITFSDG